MADKDTINIENLRRLHIESYPLPGAITHDQFLAQLYAFNGVLLEFLSEQDKRIEGLEEYIENLEVDKGIEAYHKGEMADCESGGCDG